MSAEAEIQGKGEGGDWRDFAGDFLIFRKLPRGLSKKVAGGKLPRFRHKTMESARAEVARLHGKHPESTFVIMQEVARFKGAPAEQKLEQAA
ncbi:hypothetical protein IC614_02925 [Allosphingosinicella flava]|uniref:Uncharacterized protein n=1 Tax=Allosphingosinicella flava TaxID=2771430 RepID=A0A7T2LMH9_9SPHN|nr:hypothetical protein [Sphingosinicella flava]QPQ55571.1 hypothetical protein IC614_02925 [Sphingosinicella flava]